VQFYGRLDAVNFLPGIFVTDKYAIKSNSSKNIVVGSEIEANSHIMNTSKSPSQISTDNYYVPFYDDMTGFFNSRFDVLTNDIESTLFYWRKFNCGWDKCNIKKANGTDDITRFPVEFMHMIPLNGPNMLQDYDLRDMGNKIYKNEIMDDNWNKTLDTVNSKFSKIKKINGAKSCKLGDEVEFVCQEDKL
jgi:hypothetical protein